MKDLLWVSPNDPNSLVACSEDRGAWYWLLWTKKLVKHFLLWCVSVQIIRQQRTYPFPAIQQSSKHLGRDQLTLPLHQALGWGDPCWNGWAGKMVCAQHNSRGILHLLDYWLVVIWEQPRPVKHLSLSVWSYCSPCPVLLPPLSPCHSIWLCHLHCGLSSPLTPSGSVISLHLWSSLSPCLVLVLMGQHTWVTSEEAELLNSFALNLDCKKKGNGLKMYYDQITVKFIWRFPTEPTDKEKATAKNPQELKELVDERRRRVCAVLSTSLCECELIIIASKFMSGTRCYVEMPPMLLHPRIFSTWLAKATVNPLPINSTMCTLFITSNQRTPHSKQNWPSSGSSGKSQKSSRSWTASSTTSPLPTPTSTFIMLSCDGSACCLPKKNVKNLRIGLPVWWWRRRNWWDNHRKQARKKVRMNCWLRISIFKGMLCPHLCQRCVRLTKYSVP